MPFDIPDNDVATHADQSRWMSTDIDILVAGLAGVGVVSGCGVTAQGSPDMTVAIAAGTILIASGGQVAVTSGNGTITAADATNPRIDLVSASDTGTKTVTAGTANATPKPPDLPSGHVGLAMVYVPASDTTIATNQITDKRVVLPAHTAPRSNYNPDHYPASGTALTDEFDDGSVDGAWSWTGTTPTYDETTAPGFLYVSSAKNITNKLVRAYTPGASTAFTIAAKVALAERDNDNATWTWGIAAFDSSNNILWQIYLQTSGTVRTVENMRVFGTAGTGGLCGLGASGWVYLCLTRDAADLYTAYWSLNGVLWVRLGSSTVATTVTKVGFNINNNDNTGNDRTAMADFFRVFTTATTKIGA